MVIPSNNSFAFYEFPGLEDMTRVLTFLKEIEINGEIKIIGKLHIKRNCKVGTLDSKYTAKYDNIAYLRFKDIKASLIVSVIYWHSPEILRIVKLIGFHAVYAKKRDKFMIVSNIYDI